MWKELDSLFVLLFFTYATAQKKKPEVEISVHNVFRCILTTNETITRFLLNYIATYASLNIDRAKAIGSAEKTSHNILETQQSSGRGG